MPFLKDLFTTTDNEHFEVARVGFGLTIIAMLGFQGYAIYQGQEFDPQAFATGVGILMAGGGAGVAAKDIARAKSK